MQWFYLHFPHLYGETWYDTFHSPQALAFIHDKGSCIADVNPAAKRAGVTQSMLVNTAFCMAPAMQTHVICPHKSRQALLRVARLAYRFSAWISLEPPNGLYLEVATMRKLFGGLSAIREQILTLFQALSYTLKVAAAPTAKAAHLLASSGAELCVDQANLMNTLKSLSIGCLELPQRTADKLQKLGLKTVYDVIRLPEGDLAYRIAPELADYLGKVTGSRPWQPQPVKLPEQFVHQVGLEQEAEDWRSLLFPLAASVKKYCQFMQHRCLVSQSLNIALHHRQHPQTPLIVQLASADNRADIWLYMLNHAIERVKLMAPVTGFTVKASVFDPVAPSGLPLFGHLPGMQGRDNNQHGDIAQARAALLNRLAGRLGAGRVRFAGVTADPRPEYQTVYGSQPVLPVLSGGAGSAVKTPGKPAGQESRRPPFEVNQPLWLLPQPKPVSVCQYRVLRGPLRLDTGWWDKQFVQRDYYIALERRQHSPALHWLFRTINNDWFVHGIFS